MTSTAHYTFYGMHCSKSYWVRLLLKCRVMFLLKKSKHFRAALCSGLSVNFLLFVFLVVNIRAIWLSGCPLEAFHWCPPFESLSGDFLLRNRTLPKVARISSFSGSQDFSIHRWKWFLIFTPEFQKVSQIDPSKADEPGAIVMNSLTAFYCNLHKQVQFNLSRN